MVTAHSTISMKTIGNYVQQTTQFFYFCLKFFFGRVLYFSLHRYDNGLFFPCSDEANYDHVGSEGGAGFNINVAWNGQAKGDTEYLLAFYHILMPVALEVSNSL